MFFSSLVTSALLVAGVVVATPTPVDVESRDLQKRAPPLGVAIRACTQPGTVALTFDDGPYAYTQNVLNQLKAAGMKATFFLNGQNWANINDYAAVVKQMNSDGHQIGSHTWSHADLATLGDAAVRSQMTQLETSFKNIIGKFPTYMRPPYFSYSASTLNTLKSLGYYVIDANIDTNDWQYQANIQAAVNAFTSGLNAGGSITLMHDVHQNTVTGLLPQVINIVKQRGLKAVTVGTCLGDPSSNWYRTSRTTTPPPTTPTNPPTNPGLPVSPNGQCGAAAGYRCPSGTCCSQWGWCGIEAGHCAAGCQPTYGTCS